MTFVKTTTRTAVMTLRDREVPELEIQSGLGGMVIALDDEMRRILGEMLVSGTRRATTRRHLIEILDDPRFERILSIQSAGCSRMPLNEENQRALAEMLAHRF